MYDKENLRIFNSSHVYCRAVILHKTLLDPLSVPYQFAQHSQAANVIKHEMNPAQSAHLGPVHGRDGLVKRLRDLVAFHQRRQRQAYEEGHDGDHRVQVKGVHVLP